MGTMLSFIPASSSPTPGGEIMNINTYLMTSDQLIYTLSGIPTYPTKTDVYINGVRIIYNDEYSISGANVTISTAGLGYNIDDGMILVVRWL